MAAVSVSFEAQGHLAPATNGEASVGLHFQGDNDTTRAQASFSGQVDKQTPSLPLASKPSACGDATTVVINLAVLLKAGDASGESTLAMPSGATLKLAWSDCP